MKNELHVIQYGEAEKQWEIVTAERDENIMEEIFGSNVEDKSEEEIMHTRTSFLAQISPGRDPMMYIEM